MVVEIHNPFVHIDEEVPDPDVSQEEKGEDQGDTPTDNPLSSSSPEEDQTPICPESPSHVSTSSDDSDMVLNSQLDSFAERFEALDNARKAEVASHIATTISQAEKEALPSGKPKRKKEKSYDANRASVQFSKPSRNPKMFS